MQGNRLVLIYKSGGLSELPVSYRVVDNTIIGQLDKPLAFCVGKDKSDAESEREKSICAANVFQAME